MTNRSANLDFTTMIQESQPTDANIEADSLDGEFMTAASTANPIAEPAEPAQLPAPRGHRWLATMDLEPGMIVARPVTGITGSRATLHLAIGSDITADTIAQLMNKGVECVAVVDTVDVSPETHSESVARYETRLREIFAPVPDNACRALLDALLKYGPL